VNRIKSSVAVVTGGSLGIGRAVCLLFATEGASVAVTDILTEQGQEVVGQIREQGGTAEFWHLDVTNETEVQGVFAVVRQRFGGVNILVNNASIMGADKPTNLGRRSPGGVMEYRTRLDSHHPLGYVGEPDDVAYGVLCLASAEAKFVTGSELVIDGGYTAR
jgi:NAD(P)-dependent dehydrogenase (short-subunit alcohol dehydrogenase family)